MTNYIGSFFRASGSSKTVYKHDENKFETFNSTLKVLFWSVFDPGQPGVVGCSRGIARYMSYNRKKL